MSSIAQQCGLRAICVCTTLLLLLNGGSQTLSSDDGPGVVESTESAERDIVEIDNSTVTPPAKREDLAASKSSNVEATDALDSSTAEASPFPDLSEYVQAPWFLADPTWDLLLVTGVFWSGLSLLGIAIGNRQRREGNGTWRRLIGVSTVLSGLVTLPLVVFWLIMRFWLVWSSSGAFAVSVTGIGSLMYYFIKSMRPPFRWAIGRETLPLADNELTDRVNRIAALMGVPKVVTRTMPTIDLDLQAFAGGLVAPSVALSDGILKRLPQDEQDSVIAHELAHFANHTLWYFWAVWTIALICIQCAVTVIPDRASIPWAILFACGIHLLVSRRFEYDSDRREALVVGVPTAIRSLSKIHAASSLRNTGFWSWLAFASATHPSRDQRLSALSRLANDSDEIDRSLWDEQAAARYLMVARVVWAVWGLLLLWEFVPLDGLWAGIRCWVLMLAILMPGVAHMLAIRKEARLHIAPWIASTVWSLIGLAVFLTILDAYPGSGLERLGVVAFCGVVVSVWAIHSRNKNRIPLQITQLLQQHRFEETVACAEEHAKAIAVDCSSRTNAGIALFLLGRDEDAIRELEAASKIIAKVNHAWMALAMVHPERGDAQSARKVLEEHRNRHGKSVWWNSLMFDVCIEDGLFEEAQRHLDELRAQLRESFIVPLTEATLVAAHGDAELAWQQAAEAERLSPRHPSVAFLRAELAVKFNDPRAGQFLDEADNLLRASPLYLLQRRLARLRAKLANCQASGSST